MMTIDEIKDKSSKIFLNYPIGAVSIFGSYAKGLQTEDSDVDMLLKNSNLGLLDMSRMQQQLSSTLGKKIDLICEDDLSDVFRFLIHDEEVLIYEKQR